MKPARFLPCLLITAFLPAWAARPMITDDARIVDPQACQIESWLRLNRSAPDEAWAVPACNPTGNLELALGGSLQRDERPVQRGSTLVQAKTLFRPLTTDSWGVGLAVGRTRTRASLPGAPDEVSWYTYVPWSVSLDHDAALVHLNLGLRDDRSLHRRFTTWGVASEIRLRERLQLIAETFGESGNRPSIHGGLRYWLVPERVQVDATYGTELRPGTGNRWVSIGLRLLSPPLGKR